MFEKLKIRLTCLLFKHELIKKQDKIEPEIRISWLNSHVLKIDNYFKAIGIVKVSMQPIESHGLAPPIILLS
jgi:hypothetical protein